MNEIRRAQENLDENGGGLKMETQSTNEVEAAQGRVDELHARMIRGDVGVTAAGLATAESELRFAVAKREAGERAELERAEAEKQKSVKALRKRLATEFKPEPMAALEEKVAEAVENYVRACSERRAALGDIREALADLGPLPDTAPLDYAARAGVRIGDTEAMPERPQSVLSRIVREAYTKFFPRGGYSFDNPRD
jgi:hypothetical protein